MNSRLLTVILLVALAFGGVQLVSSYHNNYFLPGNNQGYEPVQPIAYSHRLHAGELEIPCLYCHSTAETSSHAGIPSTSTCMNCHKFVSAPFVDVVAEDERATKEKRSPQKIVSPEIEKVYKALSLGKDMNRVPGGLITPVKWTRIHVNPDFVYFNHSVHVSAGVDCQKCHGEVQTMERVRQVSDLSMGWCVNCHRDVNKTGVAGKRVKAPIDCAACHY